MARTRRLIIGLGNPGSEYEGTRHNAGFMGVDRLAERAGVDLAHEGDALVGWAQHQGDPYGLAKPLTYVNRSGMAIRQLIRTYELSAGELLVLVDDVHLPPGDIRLRPGGGTGGHNGLQSIIDRLGTQDFPRLRIGIGDDFGRGQLVDYVLSPFSSDQRPFVDKAIDQAGEAALTFISEGITAAMNQFN